MNWNLRRFRCVFLATILGAALAAASGELVPARAQVNGGAFVLTDLVVEILEEGEGAAIEVGQELLVEFTSWIVEDGEQGRLFDSSEERGGPWEFVLGAHPAIKGWDEGLEGTRIGTRIRLTIPPDMAYGDRGFNGPVAFVPPGSWIISEIVVIGAN